MRDSQPWHVAQAWCCASCHGSPTVMVHYIYICFVFDICDTISVAIYITFKNLHRHTFSPSLRFVFSLSLTHILSLFLSLFRSFSCSFCLSLSFSLVFSHLHTIHCNSTITRNPFILTYTHYIYRSDNIFTFL